MSTKIGLEWIVGSTVIPATAMIMMGQPWIAAGIIGAGLVAAVLIVRIRARVASERDREILSYASTAATFGTDPARVIEALRRGDPEDVVEEARGPYLHRPRGRW